MSKNGVHEILINQYKDTPKILINHYLPENKCIQCDKQNNVICIPMCGCNLDICQNSVKEKFHVLA